MIVYKAQLVSTWDFQVSRKEIEEYCAKHNVVFDEEKVATIMHQMIEQEPICYDDNDVVITSIQGE